MYGPARVIVVGGDEQVRHVATARDALWRPDLRAVPDALGPEAEYLWFLRSRSRPRSDALGALVGDIERTEASIAGSKILDAGEPEHLLAVGVATDVFSAPYTGLQDDELDQEQYDVIRDVAAVTGASMLVRRDLYRGLGGVDRTLAPNSAAVDLCQRARLRGARVIVIPASEVLYEGPDPTPEWRERAGEIRSMIKAYGPITLLWAIPLALLAGLAESIMAPFLGKWPIFGWVAAWVWNILYLPATIAARLQVRRGRAVGDEELFRYQVGGSARLRVMYDRILERVRERFPEGVLAGFIDVVESGQQVLRRPSFVAATLGVVAALVATRVIWGEALPAVGYSLPPPESAGAALSAYAGGWNPAGLGSPGVLRPEIAAVALVQSALFGNGGVAVALITVAAVIAGVVGVARLLRSWGVASVAGYAAGVVYAMGPPAMGIGSTTHWGAIVALGVIPWAIAGSVAVWPREWGLRFVRIAAITIGFGLVGAFSPGLLPVPLLAVFAWTALGTGPRWWAPVRAAAGALLALPLLMPWVLYADLGGLYTSGQLAFWEPWLPTAAIVGVSLLAGLLGSDGNRAVVAGWGGLLVALGALAARSGGYGGGEEALLAGLAAMALGLAAIVGIAFEAAARRGEYSGLRRLAAGLAAIGGALLVVAAVPGAADGRLGMPSDDVTGAYDFASASGFSTGQILLFGTGEGAMGETRDFEGLAYRVFTPPVPASWEARLAEPRLGDDALEGLLDDLIIGSERRAGERLADFGIGWVVFSEESPFESVFESQLDLIPLRSLPFGAFRNEVAAAVVLGDDGSVWERDGGGFAMPESWEGTTVRVAQNADFRWGPGEWEQAGWASLVTPDADADVVGFGGHGGRRTMALAAGAWFGVLLLVAMAKRWLR